MTLDFQVPVLVVGFNRPDLLRKQLDLLAQVGAKRVYVALDGPRDGFSKDITNVAFCRDLAIELSVVTEVRLFVRDQNAGARINVREAIDWFFENESAGIILEDDCVPGMPFFSFCSTMLEKFADDDRVVQLAGNVFRGQAEGCTGDFFFSRVPHIWGWATWRRAWDKYAWFEQLESERQNNLLETGATRLGLPPRAVKRKFWGTMEGSRGSWDGIWFAAVVATGGLTLFPAQNLVSNLGFGADATHTTSSRSLLVGLMEESSDEFHAIPKADELTSCKKSEAFQLRVIHDFRGKVVRAIWRAYYLILHMKRHWR